MSSTSTDMVTGAATASTSIDSTTKVNAGLGQKSPVSCATTGNIALSGLQTIDGVATTAGMSVLVQNQTTTSQNGIYLAATGAWARRSDFDGADDVLTGTQVRVGGGSTQSGMYVLTSTNTVPDGSTAVTFTKDTLDPAASLTVPVQINAGVDTAFADADMLTARKNADGSLIKRSWLNVKSLIWTALGPAIAALTAKATVVDGDGVVISDSAAAGASKLTTFTQLWANYFKAKADALYQLTGLAVLKGTSSTITVGYLLTPGSLGNIGNITVNVATQGNYAYGTNHAAITVTAPANDCAAEWDVINDATAGAWTFTGFTGTDHGAAMTTVNGDAFTITFRRMNGISRYVVKAWQ